jgi:hypothetical protein
VNLIEIDCIDFHSLQTGFCFSSDGSGLQVMRNVSRLVPDQAALGENVGAVAKAPDGLADNRLGMPQPVDGRGVDPVHAHVQSCVDRGDELRIILMAPGEFPLSTADGPCAHTCRRDPQVTLSQLS